MFTGPDKKPGMLDPGCSVLDGNGREGALRRLSKAFGTARRLYHRGFTLLEIMLAVGILGLMSLAIFRFVQSSMIALRVSSNTTAADAQYDGLRDLLTAEWQSLNPQRARLTGEPLKVNDRQRDVVGWFGSAGPGLLTRYAPGEFKVVLRLQPENEKSNRLDLGLLRKPKDDSIEGHESWVPLIKNVSSLQISYYNPRANAWVDRWPGGSLPLLVKLTVGRTDASTPWEAIIPITRTPFKN
jgi:prepilin-type N-terminal cleavage/methylation domain-containing protein